MARSDMTPPLIAAHDDPGRVQAADQPTQVAISAVVREHSAMVLGVCRRMLTPGDAEDAAQAVFLLFWQKARHLVDESRIAGWLHRTAQHVCRNEKRSRVSRIVHERKAAAESGNMSLESTVQAQWNEIREILDEEVNRLPENLRIAFILFHCEHRSLADVALRFGSTVPTVGSWLQRAREKLAVRLRSLVLGVGAASLAAILSQQMLAEAAPAVFITATCHTVAGFSTAGLTACTPSISALVQAGAAGGLSKPFWMVLSLIVFTAISLPTFVVGVWPAIQTRQAPDFPRLQGDWREVANEQGGEPVSSNTVEFESTLRISGRNFRRFQRLANGRLLEGGSGSFVLRHARSPAEIDFKQWQGTAFAIYKLQEGELTICIARNGGPRPTEFSTKKNDDRMLLRYRKVP